MEERKWSDWLWSNYISKSFVLKRSKHIHVIWVPFYIAVKLNVRWVLLVRIQTTGVSSSCSTCCCYFSLVRLRKPNLAQSVALSCFPCLSLFLSLSPLPVLSLTERWHWETAVTWDASRSWQGLRKAAAEGRERAFIWDWGRWPPFIPLLFFFFLSLACLYVC